MATRKTAAEDDNGATDGRRRRNRTTEVRDGAISVFYEKGYSAASIQDVADAVGVLKGSLYHYISSKEDLLSDIYDDAYADAMAIIDDVTALDVTPLERLRTYLERHVTWYLENVEHAAVSFREWRNFTGERYDAVVARWHAYERFVLSLLEDCRKAGEVHADVNLLYARHFILGAVNAVPYWYRRSGPDSPRTIARIYADITVAALVGTDPARDLSVALAPR